MKCLGVYLFIIIFSSIGQSKKILGVSPLCATSHYSLMFKLLRTLSERGHEVTFLQGFPPKSNIRNLREIHVVELCVVFPQEVKNSLYDMGRMKYHGQLQFIANLGSTYTDAVLKNEAVRKLLNSSETFDLVLIEHFTNEALFYIPYKFKVPYVILAPGPTTVFNNHLMGNPSPSSFVPNLLGEFDGRMTFWQRVKNTYYNVLGEFFVHNVQIPLQNAILKRHIPDAPDLTDIIYNASMMLLISHPSIGGPLPLLPNIKEVGGYHVDPVKPLPKDIQEFLDDATEGVVVFSMGSNLRSSEFPIAKKQAILKAFSKIKQKVLWKFETDLPEKPSNVKILSWLPQQDVLAHPNVVAFVSHGGLLGTIEGVYFGVPILGLPVFWDQMKNIEDVARKGFGIKLNFESVTEESFDAALTEILTNKKYLENARMRSKLMHDQPLTQLDEAIFWIEYAIRNKGAPHLRSPGIDLKWYQRYLLDVILLVSSVALFVPLLIFIVLRKLLSGSSKVDQTKKSN